MSLPRSHEGLADVDSDRTEIGSSAEGLTVSAEVSRTIGAELTLAPSASPLSATLSQGGSQGVFGDATPTQPASALSEAIQQSLGAPFRAPNHWLVKRLGKGGFGEVWLAEDKLSGKRVAIKFLAHGAGQRWESLLNEVQRLVLLDSDPGIIQLYDVHPDGNPPYFTMKWAEHGSLAAKLDSQGPLPVAEGTRIFREIAQAMAYVHVKGIHHCDLKPANVLLDACNRALIADFGQAQFSRDASPALGSLFYMAPEQAEARDQMSDTRWDVHALGAIAYAMLTGKPPRFDPALREEIGQTRELDHQLRLYRDGVRAATKPAEHRAIRGVDRELADIIDRCLEVDPARRYQDASDVLVALQRRERRRRQRPALVFGLGAPLVLLLIVLVANLYSGILTAKAINRATANHLEFMQSSDDSIAQFFALALKGVVDERKGLIERFAVRDDVAAAITSGNKTRLNELLLRHLAPGAEALGFKRCNIADSKGSILAYVKRDNAGHWSAGTEGLGRNIAFREWFNGDKQERRGTHYDPLSKSHISRPYRPIEVKDGKEFIGESGSAVSAPVFARGTGVKSRVAGVVSAQIPAEVVFGHIATAKSAAGKQNRFFTVLVDDRCVIHYYGDKTGELVDYINNNESNVCPHGQPSCPFRDLINNPASHPDGPEKENRILGNQASSIKNREYTSPVDKRKYLVGVSQLSELPWAVIVQYDKEEALKPTKEITRTLSTSGAWDLFIALAFTGGVWWLLRGALRREEEIAHG
jgi:hypothetical protein